MAGSNKWFVVVPDPKGVLEMGREIAADQLAIEPSGAVTFWDHVIPGERQSLVAALANGHWISIHPMPALDEDNTPDEFKESAQR